MDTYILIFIIVAALILFLGLLSCTLAIESINNASNDKSRQEIDSKK
ncbi:hypothetical protein [Winogradskyella sp.]|nr:hypothetical protein [Winogradskyella sp.]